MALFNNAMPQLTIISPQGVQRQIDLPTDGAYKGRIGREKHCDIIITEPSVSGEHALIEYKNGSYIIEDLGSTNGIKINGHTPMGASALFDGDKIQLGDVQIIYKEQAETEPETRPDPTETDEATAKSQDNLSIQLQELAKNASREATKSLISNTIYGIIIFVCAIIAGLSYEHYQRTGELLPLQWLNIETPKQSIEKLQKEYNEKKATEQNSETTPE